MTARSAILTSRLLTQETLGAPLPLTTPEVQVPLNDLRRAIARDRASLEAAAKAVFDSGYLIMGSQHAAFEFALADYLGVEEALGVASGTDALEVAMKAVIPAGRRTILTAANAGGYTSIAARRAGFKVAYADVDPNTLCLSADTVEAALTDDVGIVVVTHLYGNLTDIRALVDLCHSRDVGVIEDAAQAIGARNGYGAAGSFGDAACISFYPTKNLGALGDGGAVVTNDPKIAEKARTLRQYGWSLRYVAETPWGVNSRLDELQAAFLLSKLPQLDDLNQRRREIIGRYTAAAAGTALRVLPAIGESHVGHLAVALANKRESTRAHFTSYGIATEVHFPVPDYRQPGLGNSQYALPVTEVVTSQVMSLPCFPELTEEEINLVCAAIHALPSEG